MLSAILRMYDIVTLLAKDIGETDRFEVLFVISPKHHGEFCLILVLFG